MNDTQPEIRRIVLYPFIYYDLMRRKWMRARYVATIEDIAARGDPFRVIGQPEIREFRRDARIITDAH
jgi:hypothetical protein